MSSVIVSFHKGQLSSTEQRSFRENRATPIKLTRGIHSSNKVILIDRPSTWFIWISKHVGNQRLVNTKYYLCQTIIQTSLLTYAAPYVFFIDLCGLMFGLLTRGRFLLIQNQVVDVYRQLRHGGGGGGHVFNVKARGWVWGDVGGRGAGV